MPAKYQAIFPGNFPGLIVHLITLSVPHVSHPLYKTFYQQLLHRAVHMCVRQATLVNMDEALNVHGPLFPLKNCIDMRAKGQRSHRWRAKGQWRKSKECEFSLLYIYTIPWRINNPGHLNLLKKGKGSLKLQYTVPTAHYLDVNSRGGFLDIHS